MVEEDCSYATMIPTTADERFNVSPAGPLTCESIVRFLLPRDMGEFITDDRHANVGRQGFDRPSFSGRFVRKQVILENSIRLSARQPPSYTSPALTSLEGQF